jgi:hypothetical protein
MLVILSATGWPILRSLTAKGGLSSGARPFSSHPQTYIFLHFRAVICEASGIIHVEHPAPRTILPNRQRFIEQFQNMDGIAQQFYKSIESNTESPHPFLREIASTSGRPSSKSIYPLRSTDHHILPWISLDLPMIRTLGRRNAFCLCGRGEMK